MKKIHTLLLITLLMAGCSRAPKSPQLTGELPVIYPDYRDVEIPVNIAPLNFRMEEASSALWVTFTSKGGRMEVTGGESTAIPLKKWHALLARSAGDTLTVVVSARYGDEWKQYAPFSITVREQPIDPYLVYRLIAPGYVVWSRMGIYQRNLTNFDQTPLITNSLIPGSCVNCHSFRQNDPAHMMFHLRAPGGGTILSREGIIEKLATKTEKTVSNFVYPYWHPGGKHIAFSVNKISQMFHAVSDKRIEVMDSESDLVVYDIDGNAVLTSDLISGKAFFETFPAFTPDGRKLVFCRAQALTIPAQYDSVRYDLCAIAFDPETGRFGDRIDTLVHASAMGKSVSFPRVSPDGRSLMYTLSDYGNFSIWHNEADLHLLDLETLESKPLDAVNSSRTESYHSWSSRGGWFVFSSRRDDGLYTRPYFAWLGDSGKVSKPFMLPQKDPRLYLGMMESFNIPELVKGPVNTNPDQIEKLYYQGAPKQVEESKELGTGHY